MSYMDRASNMLTKLQEVCPVKGLRIVDASDTSTWRIAFADDATADERQMANAILAAHDSSAATEVDVITERAQRLARGFNYDFGDARGVHKIGTTDADMMGWREVTDYANTLAAIGDTTTQIMIVTDTGPVLVTAQDWLAIMLAAARVRQAIWAASFTLQSLVPIPLDYAHDSHWQ